MGVTGYDVGVTATKQLHCNALLRSVSQHLPGRYSALSMGLETKTNRLGGGIGQWSKGIKVHGWLFGMVLAD